MSKKLVIKADIIEEMSENGRLRQNSFRLNEKFVGEYEVKSVAQDDIKNFRMLLSGESGRNSIHGGAFLNSIVVPKNTDLSNVSPAVEGKDNIWYFDELSTSGVDTGNYVHFIAEGKEIKLPTNLKVVGAAVSHTDLGDHPKVALRRYRGYTEMLLHHRKKNPEAQYLTERDVLNYMNSEDNPLKDKKFELPNAEDANKQESWNFTLLLEDWND